MEERKVTFSVNNDETLIKDSDGKLLNGLSKIYQDLKCNIGFCYEQLKEGKLTKGMKETHLYLAESYLIEFLKKIGYESVLGKQKEERSEEIRSLYKENMELRKQLGMKVSNEDCRERFKLISETFTEWWTVWGFGHVSDIYLTPYSLKAKLSGTPFEFRDYICEKLPDEFKNKSRIEYLQSIGFQFNEKSDKRDNEIIYNDNNFNLLKDLIKNKFPSAMITEITSWKDKFRDISIIIKNLDDVVI